MNNSTYETSVTIAFCHALLRVVATMVPAVRRDDWLAEWRGELWELWHRAERVPGRYPNPIWHVVSFAAGSIVHALAELRQDWRAEILAYEFRHALRFLARNRGFTITTSLLIALGVGANTTVFTLINAVLLRAPQGIEAPDELVQVGRGGSNALDFDSWSYPLFLDLRERNHSFTGLAAYVMQDVSIGRDNDVATAKAQLVTTNYFRVLGASLARGRGFLEDENDAGTASVAVLSDALWRRRFVQDSNIIGQIMLVRGHPFRIIGVARPEFSGADVGEARPDFWLPIAAQSVIHPGRAERLDSRFMSWIWIVARLKPGVTVAAAQADMGAAFRQLQIDRDGVARDAIALIPGLGLRPEERRLASVISGALMAIVAAVLLIACANLAALLLARGAARQTEISIRLAVGASRSRIVRQLVFETLIVAVLGSAAAFLSTHWTARLVESLLPYPVAVSLQPDVRVLLFALGLGVCASAAFGVLPAWRTASVDLLSLLRTSAANITPGGSRVRAVLLVGQIAVSFVLLGSTGLLVRTILRANSLNPGFRTTDILVGALDVQSTGSGAPSELVAQLEAVVARVAAEPGVLGVTLASAVPATGTLSTRTMWPVDGNAADARMTSVTMLVVDTAYFHVMDIPVVRGRQFNAELDRPGPPTGIIVNETFATRVWPGQNPVGKLVGYGLLTGEQRLPVIGVARDAKNRSLRAAPSPQAYLPLSQSPGGNAILHVRVALGHPAIALAIEASIRAAIPSVPAPHFETMRAHLARGFADVRLIGILGAVFGVLALALATVGIYGVVSFETARRRREFGVRLALGARPSDIHALVLSRSAKLCGTGMLLGVVATVAVSPLLRQWVFGVAPFDALTLIAVALVLSATAVLAAIGPSLRASRANALSSLRAE